MRMDMNHPSVSMIEAMEGEEATKEEITGAGMIGEAIVMGTLDLEFGMTGEVLEVDRSIREDMEEGMRGEVGVLSLMVRFGDVHVCVRCEQGAYSIVVYRPPDEATALAFSSSWRWIL